MANEGWVHLDVKPENIVMGVPPRLIDLSIARTFERAARLRGSIGTDGYMSPEQCDADAHRGEVGAPADVWGLGATLHHAVSGEVPFPRERGAGESEDRRCASRSWTGSHGRFRTASRTPCVSWWRMLAKRPQDRPTAAEVVRRLESLVAELPRKLVFGRRGARAR
jgi:serine/threonine protein kinase